MKRHKITSIHRSASLLTVLLFFTSVSFGWAQSRGSAGSETETRPWLHVLTAKQALSAEVEENKITFPKEGNPWLSKVEKYHVLWTAANGPDYDHSFAVRILKINKNSNKVTFQTARVGLMVLHSGFRDKVKKVDPSVKKLASLLPAELPGLQTRGFINLSVINDNIKGFSVLYSGVDCDFKLMIAPFSEKRFNKFKKMVEKAPKSVEMTKKQYLDGTLIWGQTSSAIKARFFSEDMEVRLRFFDPIDTETFYSIVEALDIDELETFIVAVNN